MSEQANESNLRELTAELVAAYVGNNQVQPDEFLKLIQDTFHALQKTNGAEPEPEPEPLKPAVSVKKSITPDYLICLEDGKKFKSLKRHLRTHYNLSPEEYRERWNLPSDYPMVAPNYAAARSELAKRMGLGQQRKKPTRSSSSRSKAS